MEVIMSDQPVESGPQPENQGENPMQDHTVVEHEDEQYADVEHPADTEPGNGEDEA